MEFRRSAPRIRNALAIEAKGNADPLLSEKVDKINADITALSGMKTQIEQLETIVARGEFGHGDVPFIGGQTGWKTLVPQQCQGASGKAWRHLMNISSVSPVK